MTCSECQRFGLSIPLTTTPAGLVCSVCGHETPAAEPDPPPDAPIVTYTTPNFLVGKLVGLDDYCLGVHLESTGQRCVWRTPDGKDVFCSLSDLRELHGLLGRVLSGEDGTPYTPPSTCDACQGEAGYMQDCEKCDRTGVAKVVR